MAEPLEADVQLDIGDALGRVDELRTALEEATTPPPLTIEPDVDAIAPAIGDAITEGGETSLLVDADTSEALASIEDFAALAGAFDTELGIDADTAAAEASLEDFAALADASDFEASLALDTSEAEGALSDLSASAEEAGASMFDASAGAGALDAAAGLSTGSATALGSAVGSLSDDMKGSVGIFAAGTAAVAGFFTEAVEAQGATQRFEGTLGAMADRVENLRDIEGLNTNLGDLALTLGSDDDRIREVVARLFELSRASGIGKKDAALFSQEMVALGARAVALNPNLGDVGDVTDALSTALVRGGRFAAKFGLDLNQTEINTRALTDTQKQSTDQLTFVEKAMAGAAIASEKYGKNLDGIVARGAENSITRLRRLKQTVVENIEAIGTPLIAPVFEVLEEGIPIAQQAGSVVGSLAQGALPLLSTALHLVGPPLEAISGTLDAIPAPALAAGAAVLFLSRSFEVSARGGIVATGALGKLTSNISKGQGIALAGGVAASFLGDAIGGTAGEAISATGSMAAMGFMIGGPVGAAVGGGIGLVTSLGKSLLGGGESAEEMRERVAALGKEIDKVKSPAKALRAFLESSGQDLTLGDDLDYVRKQVRALAEESPAAAQRVVAGMESLIDVQDPLTGQTLLTREEFEKLNKVVGDGAESFGKHDRAAREAAAAEQLLIDTAPTASEKILQQKEAVEAFATAALGQLPGAQSALQTTQQQLGEFGLALTDSVSPEAFLENLNASIQGILSFQGNLERAVAGNFTNVAAFVAEQGPVVGGAYLQAFLAAPPAVQQATEQALARQQTATAQFDAYLRGPFAGVITAASQAGFAGIAPEADTAAANAALALAGGIPGIEGAALTAGQRATGGVKSGVAPIPGVATSAVNNAVGGVRGLGNPAYNAGALVGAQFGDGMAGGIASRTSTVARAARRLVDAALAAARDEAEAESPSKLFARRLGEPIGEGIALGMRTSSSDVVAEAERIVRLAAQSGVPVLSLPGAAGLDAAFGGGPYLVVENVTIEVSGVSDPRQARAVGEAARDGFLNKLDGAARRRLRIGARTG